MERSITHLVRRYAIPFTSEALSCNRCSHLAGTSEGTTSSGGGNVGRGHSYPLSVTKGNEKQPSVVDAFLSSKWTFFNARKLQRYISYAIL